MHRMPEKGAVASHPALYQLKIQYFLLSSS